MTTMATGNESGTPWLATHPGTILKYELEDRGISQKDFAAMIGMQKSHLNELIKGRRPMTKSVAEKVGSALGISAVSLVNMQTRYEYDIKVVERRGAEELEARHTLSRYNEIFDVNTFFKRAGKQTATATRKLRFLADSLHLPKPSELKLETSGMFRKSAKTGLDPRMLMTWKLLAEAKARETAVGKPFRKDHRDAVVKALVIALHDNRSTESTVKKILSDEGIAFCIEEKVDRASVDGYSYIENGTPFIILTRRYNRIDNFAFALMHEVGHIYMHHPNVPKGGRKLALPNYDCDSKEEREADAFAASALIPDGLWKNAPKVRVNPSAIQREYTQWAVENGLNKWIVLGRISHETGMYKFRSDESRKIG